MTAAVASSLPLYRRVLGGDFDRLPPEVRRLHDHGGRLCAAGRCRIDRGGHPLARIIVGLFRFPPRGEDVAVRVCFNAARGVETWDRDFGGHRLISRQGSLPGQSSLLYESFGPSRFTIRPRATAEGLDLQLCGVSLLGLPLPRPLWPEIRARERVETGRFTFDVAIALPVIGLLIAYSGFLLPEVGADGKGRAA